MPIIVSGSDGSQTLSGSQTQYTDSGSQSNRAGRIGFANPGFCVGCPTFDHGNVGQDFVLSASNANIFMASTNDANVTCSIATPFRPHPARNGSHITIINMGPDSGIIANTSPFNISASCSPTSDGANTTAFLYGISSRKQQLTLSASSMVELQYFTASAQQQALGQYAGLGGYYLVRNYVTLSGSSLMPAVLGLNSVS
tara:strand:+ start:217 stop:813 length:597 start_codon:yes stop_codon:yes gene_type:complete